MIYHHTWYPVFEYYFWPWSYHQNITSCLVIVAVTLLLTFFLNISFDLVVTIGTYLWPYKICCNFSLEYVVVPVKLLLTLKLLLNITCDHLVAAVTLLLTLMSLFKHYMLLCCYLWPCSRHLNITCGLVVDIGT